MQSCRRVELQYLLAWNSKARAQTVVLTRGIRDDRIQAIVAPFELDQDEQVAVVGTGSGEGEPGYQRRNAGSAYAIQKVSSVHLQLPSLLTPSPLASLLDQPHFN